MKNHIKKSLEYVLSHRSVYMTVGELLQCNAGRFRKCHNLYAIHSEKQVFYVGTVSGQCGISRRFGMHMGKFRLVPMTEQGLFIHDRLPDSESWEVSSFSSSSFGNRTRNQSEKYMIQLLRPPLNTIYNPDPMPLLKEYWDENYPQCKERMRNEREEHDMEMESIRSTSERLRAEGLL